MKENPGILVRKLMYMKMCAGDLGREHWEYDFKFYRQDANTSDVFAL